MKLLFDICHPAHVHLFKNAIWNLQKKGHEIKITARDKEIAISLLDAYKFEYELVDRHQKTLVTKAFGMFVKNYKLLKIVKKFHPDILVSAGSPSVAHVSKIIQKPSIAFVDTEHANLTGKLTYPFTNVICTPSCYGKDHGKKHVRYNGYHELAYLHPDYFKPNTSVLGDLHLNKNDKYIILRLGSWSAIHDINSQGIGNVSELVKFVKTLEKHGNIFISSEIELPRSLQKNKLRFPPENMHSVLNFATLYIGEGETMAVESALLGTPSIDIEAINIGNKVVDVTDIHGNADELVNKYKLMFAYSDPNLALRKAIEILEDDKSGIKWEEKSKKLLKEKIDVTKFICELIESGPN